MVILLAYTRRNGKQQANARSGKNRKRGNDSRGSFPKRRLTSGQRRKTRMGTISCETRLGLYGCAQGRSRCYTACIGS